MGRVIIAALAGIAAAALFHAYYLNLPVTSRCRWDHPFSDSDKARCEQPVVERTGYSARDRHQMNDLIDNVAE